VALIDKEHRKWFEESSQHSLSLSAQMSQFAKSPQIEELEDEVPVTSTPVEQPPSAPVEEVATPPSVAMEAPNPAEPILSPEELAEVRKYRCLVMLLIKLI